MTDCWLWFEQRERDRLGGPDGHRHHHLGNAACQGRSVLYLHGQGAMAGLNRPRPGMIPPEKKYCPIQLEAPSDWNS